MGGRALVLPVPRHPGVERVPAAVAEREPEAGRRRLDTLRPLRRGRLQRRDRRRRALRVHRRSRRPHPERPLPAGAAACGLGLPPLGHRPEDVAQGDGSEEHRPRPLLLHHALVGGRPSGGLPPAEARRAAARRLGGVPRSEGAPGPAPRGGAAEGAPSPDADALRGPLPRGGADGCACLDRQGDVDGEGASARRLRRGGGGPLFAQARARRARVAAGARDAEWTRPRAGDGGGAGGGDPRLGPQDLARRLREDRQPAALQGRRQRGDEPAGRLRPHDAVPADGLVAGPDPRLGGHDGREGRRPAGVLGADDVPRRPARRRLPWDDHREGRGVEGDLPAHGARLGLRRAEEEPSPARDHLLAGPAHPVRDGGRYGAREQSAARSARAGERLAETREGVGRIPGGLLHHDGLPLPRRRGGHPLGRAAAPEGRRAARALQPRLLDLSGGHGAGGARSLEEGPPREVRRALREGEGARPPRPRLPLRVR